MGQVPVKLYTRQWCGYCTAAKHLLDQKGVTYEEIDCTSDPAMRQWLIGATGQTTVPQIFIAEQSIGGFSELRALDDAGKLDALLQAT